MSPAVPQLSAQYLASPRNAANALWRISFKHCEAGRGAATGNPIWLKHVPKIPSADGGSSDMAPAPDIHLQCTVVRIYLKTILYIILYYILLYYIKLYYIIYKYRHTHTHTSFCSSICKSACSCDESAHV